MQKKKKKSVRPNWKQQLTSSPTPTVCLTVCSNAAIFLFFFCSLFFLFFFFNNTGTFCLTHSLYLSISPPSLSLSHPCDEGDELRCAVNLISVKPVTLWQWLEGKHLLVGKARAHFGWRALVSAGAGV